MFLDNYNGLNKFYVNYAKKIRVRKHRYTPDQSQNFLIKNLGGNFDLFFNEQGVLMKSHHFDSNSHEWKHYLYSGGKLNHSDRIIMVDKDNQLKAQTTITYSKGKPIKEVYEELGHLNRKSKRVYQYEDNTMKLYLLPDDFNDSKGTFIYVYDESDRIVEEKAIRNEEELINWEKYQYAESGLKSECFGLDENGNVDSHCVNHYTESNLLIEQEQWIENREGWKRYFVYEFDDANNWTKQLTFHNGKLHLVNDREIEYY